MIINIPGYTINQDPLYTGLWTLIFRGIHNIDNTNIVIKLLKDEYPSVDTIKSFKHEYEIAKEFESTPGIVHVYSLEKYKNSYAIAMESINTPTLAETLEREKKLNLATFLELAIQITEALGQIHQLNVIHKDINPSNIMCSLLDKQIRIIDFGLSANLPKEKVSIVNPNVLEGTLSHLSPEQTGRMNRGIDYRTDFYSLGVTFYQMLTGELPFLSKDPIELVHFHIAVTPKSPHEVDPSIPEVVSAIIMKLMSKTAEDRYQNANGIIADLKTCLDQLRITGKIQSFPLASHDLYSRFQIPEKLYGRENEVKTLMQTYENVAQGGFELMFIAGQSGIGKSTLVNEIHKPIIKKNGYFISGKYEKLKNHIPYTAITQALEEFVKQLLTESEETIAKYREKILTAVGENGQFLIDVIPSLVTLIGKQAVTTELNPTERQNRFTYVFEKFLQVLTSFGHPLVIFLDDLQWADSPSIKLFQTLAANPDSHHLFIIGAYRSDAVDLIHPLTLFLERLKKRDIPYRTIQLTPLTFEDVTHIIADTLHQEYNTVQPLAQLCYDKTQGNSFFLIQLLLSLYKEKLIEFDVQKNQWTWELDKINKKNITDNVVDLMISKLQLLKPETQRAIQFASCIGNQFNLNLLFNISSEKPEDILINLQEALKEGYIFSYGENYKARSYQFTHDRIQQAAYSLINEDEKKQIHINIARLLLEQATRETEDSNYFDIANHYNKAIASAIPTIINSKELIQISQVNLNASKAAQAAAAYNLAFEYAEQGIKYMDKYAWQKEYPLMLELHMQAVETSQACGKFTEMVNYSQLALQHTKNILDEVPIIINEIRALVAQTQYDKAINVALQVLNRLGMKISLPPKKLDILFGILKIKFLMLRKSFYDVLNLPKLTDEKKIAQLKIVTATLAPVIYLKPMLVPLLASKCVALSLQYGNDERSIFTYALYGSILIVINDIERGYQFGKLSLDLIDKLHAEQMRAKSLFINCAGIKHWKDPYRTLLPLLEENFERGIAGGDLELAYFSIQNVVGMSYVAGLPLKELILKNEKYRIRAANAGKKNIYIMLSLIQQFLVNQVDIKEQPWILTGKAFDEKVMLDIYLKNQEKVSLFIFHTYKLILCYLFERFSEIKEHIRLAELNIRSGGSFPSIQSFHFYKLLSLLAIYPSSTPSEQRDILKAMKASQKKLTKWAISCPSNTMHKCLLIEAERMWRINGELEKAAALFDQAIELAQKNEFLNEQALANELAAKFYLAQGIETTARLYLEEARHCYLVWGADAKVSWLSKSYNHLLENSHFGKDKRLVSDKSSSESSDISATLKSSSIISSTIDLEKLLKQLMRMLIKNTGAQKCFLLLSKEGNYFIEAEAYKDHKSINMLQSIPLSVNLLPLSIITDVLRYKESIVLENASQSKYGTDPYIIKTQPKSIFCVPLLNQGTLSGIVYLENNLTEKVFTTSSIDVVNLLSSEMAISIDNARLYSNAKWLNKELINLNNAYERFVPRDFLSLLQKQSIIDVRLGDQIQQKMTILFADIRDFTTLSEKMSPQENFNFINSFLSLMGPVIRKHHGLIDKYIGDAIMVLYPRGADDAIQCAFEMQKSLNEFNKSREEAGREPIKIGIGINSGSLILGTVGVESCMNVTVISDAINVTSRVESLTKSYDVPILITDEIYNLLKNPSQYQIQEMNNQEKTKDGTKAIVVYKVEERK